MTSTQLPITPEEIAFRQSEEAVSKLLNVLEHPFLKEALRILRDKARPKGLLPNPTPGLHPDTNLAHYYHYMQGWHMALDNLQALAKALDPRELRQVQTESEFEYAGAEFQPIPLPKNDPT